MFTEDNLPDLVFDHAQIVADYFAAVKGEAPFKRGSAKSRR
jgi:RecB family endonuclease NucS